jgi:hypothetical protein
VAFNHIADFHDGIDVETYGNPDGSDAIHRPLYPPRKFWNRRPVAIDIYNNKMTNFHDNAVAGADSARQSSGDAPLLESPGL